MKKLLLSITLLLVLSVTTSAYSSTCPSVKATADALKSVFRQEFQVNVVKPSPVKGLCEVQLKIKGRNGVIYIDSSGKFLVKGPIINIATRQDITMATIMELNRLTPKELAKLEDYVAFTQGKSGPTIYFVTDPHCPYCKKAEELMKPLIDQGKLRVKYVLFPLKFHQGAREECISIICDNKGLEGFKNRYRSDNQCEKGKNMVDGAVNFLSEKGVGGTPTYIFPDGRYRSGIMSADQIEARLKNK